jgi:hypothetical protein
MSAPEAGFISYYIRIPGIPVWRIVLFIRSLTAKAWKQVERKMILGSYDQSYSARLMPRNHYFPENLFQHCVCQCFQRRSHGERSIEKIACRRRKTPRGHMAPDQEYRPLKRPLEAQDAQQSEFHHNGVHG